MHLLQLLPIGLLALLVAAGDHPQSSDDVESLNNKHGMSPCDMQEFFLNSCTNSRARDDSDDDDTNSTRVTPTTCTCTNLFFNLWSACIFTKTRLQNSTLPLCGSLEQKCAQASINITTEPPPPAAGTYPVWAYTQLPSSNGTFDPVAAIETASGSQSRKWTTIQIVVPIIVGLAVAAGFIVWFFVYRRRKILDRQHGRRPWMQTAGNRPRFQFPTMSSATKVRELNRTSSWSIDERDEDLEEYQFVSRPASLQGSQVSGHVRLSSSSSGTHPPVPTMLQIPTGNTTPVRTWPGKSLWKGPLQSVRRLSESIPRPWKSTRRVIVKNIPSYTKFRVDGSDSDSPLSQRHKQESLLGRTAERSNLNHETIFEREDEDDSDSDTEGFPLIPQEHSRSNHDAEPPPALPPPAQVVAPPAVNPPILPISRSPGVESSPVSNGSPRTPRQMPPSSTPPSIPLPPPPQARPQPSQPTPPSAPTSPTSQVRLQRPYPSFPPAPRAPPPPPPPVSKSPRSPRSPLSNFLPFSSPAIAPARILPPPPSNPVPPQPRSRPTSDSGASVRSLPMTPTPPYVRAARPAPIEVVDEPQTTNTPPHSAPPYVTRPSQDYSHSPAIPARSPPRSVRRLPLPPGQ
ncbi:hypothetical protein FB451DRAFT_1202755 [Mycena latifolia]|nr:hypothetical protein FB451DRAFT_1202755 [Mycena latifolia]